MIWTIHGITEEDLALLGIQLRLFNQAKRAFTAHLCLSNSIFLIMWLYFLYPLIGYLIIIVLLYCDWQYLTAYILYTIIHIISCSKRGTAGGISLKFELSLKMLGFPRNILKIRLSFGIPSKNTPRNKELPGAYTSYDTLHTSSISPCLIFHWGGKECFLISVNLLFF